MRHFLCCNVIFVFWMMQRHPVAFQIRWYEMAILKVIIAVLNCFLNRWRFGLRAFTKLLL